MSLTAMRTEPEAIEKKLRWVNTFENRPAQTAFMGGSDCIYQVNSQFQVLSVHKETQVQIIKMETVP